MLLWICLAGCTTGHPYGRTVQRLPFAGGTLDVTRNVWPRWPTDRDGLFFVTWLQGSYGCQLHAWLGERPILRLAPDGRLGIVVRPHKQTAYRLVVYQGFKLVVGKDGWKKTDFRQSTQVFGSRTAALRALRNLPVPARSQPE